MYVYQRNGLHQLDLFLIAKHPPKIWCYSVTVDLILVYEGLSLVFSQLVTYNCNPNLISDNYTLAKSYDNTAAC